MKDRLKFEPIFEDARKLGIGLMLVGFIGTIIRDDVSTISGGILTGIGVSIWFVGIFRWSNQ